MLRITTTQEDGKKVTLRLSGQLTGKYITELERALNNNGTTRRTATLDLTNVDFVDREGMIFLCTAMARNISIENLPSYVQRWIQQEPRCRSTEAEPHHSASNDA